MPDPVLQNLPSCLSYLDEPYLKDTDEEIVVASLSSKARDGIEGVTQIYTALIPLDELDAVLKQEGGIGYKVQSWGPGPIVDDSQTYTTGFWIDGPGEKRFEPLVVGWANHSRTVMVPDNGFLMTYGLTPRFLKTDETIAWDDLSGPVYDVAVVKPLSKYDAPSRHSGAEVRINRQYGEDYASLKGCALVAVYYEDRWFPGDKELQALIGDTSGKSFVLPGKRLTVSVQNSRPTTPHFCRVWGVRLLLVPEGRPVTDESDPYLTCPALIWPGSTEAMTYEQAMQSMPFEAVFVRDEVLCLYEKNPEFEVNPLSGSVGYEGQWDLGYSNRIGRDFIAYELKKLYEGCASSVIRHVHKFAVPKALAERQREELGEANIGTRAGNYVEAYLLLIDALADFADGIGLAFEGSDIGTLDKGRIEYIGWWSNEDLKSLAWVALPTMSEPEFLSRCKEIYKLLENLKEKPLRRMLTTLGIPKTEIKEHRSLRLLAMLMQLFWIADESGLDFPADKEALVARLADDPKISAIGTLFKLNALRQVDSHSISLADNPRYLETLESFGIDRTAMHNGWGRALDQIYDQVIASILALRNLIPAIDQG